MYSIMMTVTAKLMFRQWRRATANGLDLNIRFDSIEI
jgi:hypothetical protein